MGLITKKLSIIGRRGQAEVEALFDTGSSLSLLRESIAERIGEPHELPEPKRFEAAVGRFTARLGVFVDVVIQGRRLLVGLTVVPELTEDLILGVDFLERWHIRLDPRRKRIILDPRALRLKAVGMRHRPSRT